MGTTDRSRVRGSMDRRVWVQYGICAVAAMLVIWAHRYPAGIDLPQHANAIQLLVRYFETGSSNPFYYDLDFFNPYSAVYIVAWPFAAMWGAVVAVKVVLTLSVLATPFALRRFLVSVGADPVFAPLGFLFAFGFGYHWGFISFVFSAPVSLFYLASVVELRRAGSTRNLAASSLLLFLLFFSHGATFTVVAAAAGLHVALQKNWKSIAHEILHFVPAALVFIPWYLRHRTHATGGSSGPPNPERLVSLFSGLFSASPSYYAMLAGLGLAAFVFLFGRPRLASSPIRILPLGIGLVGLFTVPETVGATWLVGTRFLHFVHLYGLAAFDYSPALQVRRMLGWLTCGVTVLLLGTLNYRMSVFNRELDGLSRIGEHVPPGSDLRLTIGSARSEAFGHFSLSQVVAWVPAVQGGTLENDQSFYWNNPLQRRPDLPWLSEYAFHVSREESAASIRPSSNPTVVAVGNFVIRELPRTKLDLPGLVLVRAVHATRSPSQRPVEISGTHYPRAVAVAPQSVLEVRPADGTTRTLFGRFRVDQLGAGHRAWAEITNARREVLWRSPSDWDANSLPAEFSLRLDHLTGSLFLRVYSEDSSGNPQWLELEARP